MSADVALVFQGHNTLRYLVALLGNNEAPSTITGIVDFGPDAIAGPLRAIARARLDGIGTIAPGPITQAQARALLLADGASANIGGVNVPRAKCLITPIDPLDSDTWRVDADVDVDGDPVVRINGFVPMSPATRSAYLDITFIGGIGTC
jgi:hypothetical protein